MKSEIMNQPNPESLDPSGEVEVSSSNPHLAWNTAFASAGAMFCMCLSSCVIPADDHYGSRSTTYTTYQPGYRVQTLPSGYRREVISGNTYYYDGGNYYRRSGDGYLITDAPRSSRYYNDYGRVREESTRRYDSHDYGRRDDRHNRDGVIERLPDGYRTVDYRGRQYYRVGDRYYIRQNDRYIMVAKPY